MIRILLLLIVSATLASPAAAKSKAADAPHVKALKECQSITNPEQRLACFDRASAIMVQDAEQGGLVIMSREEVGTVKRSLFGFPLPKISLFGGNDKDEPEQPKELVSTLKSISGSGVGRYRFVIEDGDAVWETVDSTPYYSAKRGDKVIIRKAVLGSYFFKAGKEIWVRARRVN